MRVEARRSEAPAAIRADLGAIFVALELRRSKRLKASLPPGGEGYPRQNLVEKTLCAKILRDAPERNGGRRGGTGGMTKASPAPGFFAGPRIVPRRARGMSRKRETTASQRGHGLRQ